MENGLNKRNWASDLLCMFPAFLFSLSILLVRLHLFSMPLTNIFWTEAKDSSILADLFGYWKSVTIIVAGCLGIAFLLVGYVGDKICFKKSFLYIPTVIYILFILLSLAFSKYKYFAIHGMQEHFEGSVVLLAYIAMLFFLVNVVDSERRTKIVILCVLGMGLLLGLLGVTQATGQDFFTTAIGQKVITPNTVMESGIKSWDMIDILASQGKQMYEFSFTKGEVYQTVYNINYVPFYLSLLIPVSAILFVFYNKKNDRSRIFFSFLFLTLYGILLYNFFAANSAGGYFGLVAIFGAAIILFAKYLRNWIKPILCLIVISGLVMGILADRWLPEIKGVFSVAMNNLATLIYADSSGETEKVFENRPGSVFCPMDYIVMKDGELFFAMNGDAIVASRDADNGAFLLSNINKEPLPLDEINGNSGVFAVMDEHFHDYVKLTLTEIKGEKALVFRMRFYDWVFRYDESIGEFLYENQVGKEVLLTKIPHSNLIQDYSFGNARGRIWAATIPLLNDYLLVGAGADVFPFVFPQNDYVTMYNLDKGGHMSLVTDKAHNLYMQYWINTGLISLLAWLTLVGYYLVGAVKSFRKRGFTEFSDFVNGGIFCGIIGFLFVAFFNDGSVNTMPMFYTMLGTGLAINMKDQWPGAASSVKSGKRGQASMPEI